MIGTILKGCQIVEKVKDGSVGTVWRARNPQNHSVAIKILAPEHSRLPRKIRQFKHEATLTQKLGHRYIIRVHEYVPASPQPYFIMEYFPSENLKYAMWHMPDRVWKKEFYILRQIAEALAYLHAQGIVHRDVKPENVLINPNAEVRLIDFSLAQSKWDRLLQFGKRVEGTPLYMSPEQIRGERCGPQSDMYSFGVLMYELLAKQPPFIGTTERKILEKHVKEPPPPMSIHVSTISSDLDALVKKMLAKNPADRFKDMTAILFELSRWERKDTQIRIRQVDPGKTKDELGSVR